ncbi:MAG: hypothetical protein COZ80_06820 [Ignavibacteria bacterium CG_4_8_14_3_um_filter_37_9]|nr:MAG: hypothetical protein COW85_11550 [Ignavibacteria bacterium CG22_combo_CG10-13_8_21_14_all_37_15]PIW99157.1 MAG: hypothetical protein COZ80_06820 [Ignavibacteria bacterium CG_4_8_14_3_um_filter_37_9]
MNNFVQFVMKRGSFLLLFLFLSLSARGQTKTNLELFFQLADSAASGLAQNLINGKNVQIDFVLGKDYQVFQNTLLAHFQDKDIKDRAGKVSVRFAVTDVRIDYGEPERKSLFGPFIVKRTLHFSGNYSIISATSEVKDFSYSLNNEFPYEGIPSVENSSFPFTQGKIPKEPFFSSLLEPAIALGSAAAAVYIFFTARSK